MLEQLMLRYVAAEDRLELGLITTAPAAAHRLHLTRRLTRTWLQQLAKAIEVSAEVPASAAPATRKAIAAAHHESVAARARFERSSAQDSTGGQMLADAPAALVRNIQCGRRRADGLWLLRFAYGPGQTVSLLLKPETLHGLVELLIRQLATTDWQLDTPLGQGVSLEAFRGTFH